MRPGGLTTQAPGHIRDMMRVFDVDVMSRNTARIVMGPMSTYRDRWFAIYVNGKFSPPLVYLSATTVNKTIYRYFEGTNITVNVEDFGGWAFNPYLMNQYIWVNEQVEESTRTLRFTWTVPTTFSQSNGYVSTLRDDTQLSAISLTGIQRFTNCRSTSPTTAELYYRISQTGGVTTIDWYAANAATYSEENRVATGTYTGGAGTIAATEVNSSGIAVSSDFTYTGDGDGYIEIEWPEKYQIHYSTSALAFPRTPEATYNDAGADNFYYESATVTPGTYNAAVVPIRKGVAQAVGIAPTSGLVVPDMPAQATITSVSGNAATTTINWSLGTSGCTFNVYRSLIDRPVNYGSFVAPAVTTTALNATSSTIVVVGYPGKVRVAVHAVKAGIENPLAAEYEIEYDATGAIVAARPNRAFIERVTKTALDITVAASYSTDDEAAVTTAVDLFIKPVGTALDFTTAQATASWSTNAQQLKTANLTYSAPATGWYHMAVKARTAGGVYSESYVEWEEFLTNVAPTGTPSNILIAAGN